MVQRVDIMRNTFNGFLVLAMSAALAHAQEQVVLNDSIVDFGQAVLVGDFDASEQVAAWLTSPCDGDIVALQILWFSADAAAIPTLEENMWVYAQGAFPDPGAVLLQLEGPVLTPGSLNEFRSIDKAGTPFAISVSEGEVFVVSLEFGNATNILAGTPSILRDTDGCQGGRNALFAPFQGGWINFCTFLQGDVAIRAVVDCAAPMGGCCLPTGECQDGVSSGLCVGLGGVYQGNNTDCGIIDCPDPMEACCFLSGGCLDLTAENCIAAKGFRQGVGTTCDAIECFAAGACCMPAGQCVEEVPPDVCEAAGGVFQGNDSVCDDVICPQPQGACCLSNGNCLILTDADCSIIPNSAWAGFETDCADDNSNGIADDCESGCNDPPQDIDADCDVDISDFALFQACFDTTGAALPPECACFDADADSDVDLDDYSAFQSVFTGMGAGCP